MGTDAWARPRRRGQDAAVRPPSDCEEEEEEAGLPAGQPLRPGTRTQGPGQPDPQRCEGPRRARQNPRPSRRLQERSAGPRSHCVFSPLPVPPSPPLPRQGTHSSHSSPQSLPPALLRPRPAPSNPERPHNQPQRQNNAGSYSAHPPRYAHGPASRPAAVRAQGRKKREERACPSAALLKNAITLPRSW